MVPSAPAQRAFNWIDLLAIPLATAVMETQPIAILLLFISEFTTQEIQPWVLNAGIITLLVLGLQWWAMFVAFLVRHQRYERYGRILHLAGLVMAIVLLALSVDSSILIPAALFTLGFWWLGLVQSHAELRDERLILTFKIGFLVLVGTLVLAFGAPTPADILTPLALDLPLFFLSGLFALSFTRLSMIRKEQARLPGVMQTNTIRSWFLTLTLAWSAMMVCALALETFSFQFIQNLVQPLWNLLGLLIDWVLFLLFVLLSLFKFPSISALPPPSLSHPQYSAIAAQHAPAALSSSLVLIARLIFIVLALLLIFFIIRAILRTWRLAHPQESEEEIREGLSLRAFLQELRPQQTSPPLQENPLEQLDPVSARARYRSLLQTLAMQEKFLAHRSNETPLEYERRLLTRLPQLPDDALQEQLADTLQLKELTTAYMYERYAGKASQPAGGDFPTWLRRIVRRLAGQPIAPTREVTTSLEHLPPEER
jgi:hypothetical protein